MKTLLTSVFALLLSLSVNAGIPYVISPTNTPTLGMQLFSGGPAGVNYWDWSTNSAGSNSTVVSASTSIGVTTNGFNFTPFLSAQVTNWITGQDTVVSNGVYGLFNGGTNITFGYARSLSAADTNNDTVVSNGVYGLFNGGTNITFGYARTIGDLATNRVDYASNKLWLMITNVYVDTGTGGSTNRSGQNVTYTIVPGTGGSGTGIATNNGTGTNNIFTGPTLVGSGASSNSLLVTYGTTPTLQSRTNGDLVIGGIAYANGAGTTNLNYHTALTNLPAQTVLGADTAGAAVALTMGANMSIVAGALVGAAGSGTGIATNNGTGTNNTFVGPMIQNPVVTNNASRIYFGITNGFMPVINAMDFGLSTNSDNTAAIQNAINAATNYGQTVFIPASPNGAWEVDGTLQVYRQRLIGEAPAYGGVISPKTGTLLDHGANNGAVINLNGDGSEVGWIGVRGNGTGNGYGITATNAAGGKAASNFSIHDCSATSLERGIFLTYSWDIVLQNNFTVNCLRGIDLSNQVNGVTIIGGHYGGGANSYGLYVEGGAGNLYGVTAMGMVFESLSNAVYSSGNVQKLNVIGAYFEANTNNFVLNGGEGCSVRDSTFIQGSGPSTTNIIIVGSTFPTIKDNVFYDTSPAWHIDSTTTGADVWHNYVNPTAIPKNVLSSSTSLYHGGTNIVMTGGSYYGPSLIGGGLSQLADTNWVISQFSSLGGLVYSSGVTNALTMTNNAAGETGYRTNIWQGQASVPTVITTNTISMVTATAGTYVRHYVSTNKYVTIGAGPVNVVSYLFRSGAAGTVSGHYEIYAVDSVTGQMTELTSSTTHTIAETVPTLHQFTMSIPTDYTPANQLYLAVAFKLDSVVNGQTFNFVSGSNYDGHISFARPLSSATITMSQVAGLGAALTGTTNFTLASGPSLTNLVMILNTNAPGAAFKVIGSNGGSAAYVTNLTGNITLADLDLTGVRADSVWSLFIHAVADGTPRTVTMPNGVVGSGLALPCVFTVTNGQSANFQLTGITGQWTNVAWMPVY